MGRKKETIICKIKTTADADKNYALIDTAKNALLRIGDLVKRGDDNLKRNYGILALAIDGIADETKNLKYTNAAYEEKLRTMRAEVAALKEANPGRMERVLKSANGIVDKIAENVANRVSKHLNVRSKTESEATERTKGYDLFAAETPAVFRAYLERIGKLKNRQIRKVNKNMIALVMNLNHLQKKNLKEQYKQSHKKGGRPSTMFDIETNNRMTV